MSPGVLDYTMSYDMTECLLGPRPHPGSHHDFDDFTTYDFTTFTTSRRVIDLEILPFCDFSRIYVLK